MAFFKKWKINNKHKKLSEELVLATSLKDLTKDLHSNDESIIDGADDNNGEEDEETIGTFNLKYLGSTAIESEGSKNATATAIKSVISSAKSSRKKSQRVKVIVSSRGIEVFDGTTAECILKVSIYKISYCSADAAHDHVFAFIGSATESADENNTADSSKSDSDKKPEEENLSCYVFLCPKRKIAHDVTLTVARCFENAYQNWRNSVERKMYQDEIRNRYNSKKFAEKGSNIMSSKKDTNTTTTTTTTTMIQELLIDLSPDISSDIYTPRKDAKNYLQNTWISFEDDTKDEFLQISPWEQPQQKQQYQQQLVF